MATMRVGRYNYRGQFGDDPSTLIAELGDMLLSGRYILTAEVETFEAAFAAALGVKHARGLNSGTDALIIALRACGIVAGDEVITQANTFHATVAAIRLCGARPVLVDADEASFSMDAGGLADALTPRTRAVIPVHLYGLPAPMDAVLARVRGFDVTVIEDAAQAVGARIDGRQVGSFGTAACFSFHPSKNLAAAGDGGAIVTNDDDLDRQVRRLRELGQDGQNHHVTVGLNSKLDALQAAVLKFKLPRLPEWNAARRAVATMYRERLAGLPLGFQRVGDREEHVYHLFQVRTERRDDLLRHLRGAGVDAVVRYPTPIHLQPAFADLGWRKGDFPVAERLAAELLCLPIRPDLTADEIDYVADSVRGFFRDR
jgi:dTDP-4-amino-4,6-dideoxygalactose transaminase